MTIKRYIVLLSLYIALIQSIMLYPVLCVTKTDCYMNLDKPIFEMFAKFKINKKD